MLPDVSDVDIEASDVLVPSNQHSWVVVDTDTPYGLCIWDAGYQSYVIWIYTEIENII